MADATVTEPQGSAAEKDPRFQQARKEGLGERGREMVAHAAQGAELDAEEEGSALDWLLGASQPIVHDVPVQLETPKGLAKLTFVLKQMDTRKIDQIETRHVNQSTGRIDRLSADVDIVTDATIELRDASGRALKLSSDEFKTVQRPDGGQPFKHASPAEALEERFRKQLGLIGGVAMEIRKMAGFEPERVGSAQRRLVEASLG